MNKNYFFIFLLFISSVQLNAQLKLSPKATVSVVTCGPGSELYSAFGHSAFRVNDPVLGLDKIYNYGTFDFNAPNFYLNFAKGKLIYQLSTTRFDYFLREFQYENRWVKTQELNLNEEEVQKVFDFLENNAKPENREYRYDFFYDNCSTKMEYVIKEILKDSVTFRNNHITTTKSHRDLIADYTTNFKWAKFGIDLALGSVIDDEATKDEYKFLPDYIFEAFNNASINIDSTEKPLVKSERTVLTEKKQLASLELTQPFFLFTLLFFLVAFLTYKNYSIHKRTKWIDFSLYFSTGVVGIVVLLLWFTTSHTATYKNFNFLWAFAPNLLIAFFMLKTNLPKWIKFYNLGLLFLLVVMLILWLLKIQVFNGAIIPVILALALRYSFLIIQKNKVV